jgi:hypothetical protein
MQGAKQDEKPKVTFITMGEAQKKAPHSHVLHLLADADDDEMPPYLINATFHAGKSGEQNETQKRFAQLIEELFLEGKVYAITAQNEHFLTFDEDILQHMQSKDLISNADHELLGRQFNQIHETHQTNHREWDR